MDKIRIGVVGYGNVGRGVIKAVEAAADMSLVGVFTRREPETVEAGKVSVYSVKDAVKMKDAIDVMILCGGSATDLTKQGPEFAKYFNIVDSFDTHAKIPEYLAAVDEAAERTAAVISSGWDPGLFSIIRLLSQSVLPDGVTNTFWGRGVSQGHSDAIRRIPGVKNAVQYTVPIEKAVESARSGSRLELTARDKHLRQCYVVAESGADLLCIEREIKQLPNYFADYETTVDFISESEFEKNHKKMPHGGTVLHSGTTDGNNHTVEFSLKLESNPEFTGSVMTAYARAAFRLSKEGSYGAKTVFDIPPVYLCVPDRATIISKLL